MSLVAGGEGDNSKGFFIQPTIFADVDENARVMKEEIFGPVVAYLLRLKILIMQLILQIIQSMD